MSAGRSVFNRFGGGGFGKPTVTQKPEGFIRDVPDAEAATIYGAGPGPRRSIPGDVEAPSGTTQPRGQTSGRNTSRSSGRDTESGSQVAGNNSSSPTRTSQNVPEDATLGSRDAAPQTRKGNAFSQDKSIVQRRQQPSNYQQEHLVEFSGGDKQQYVPDLSHITGKTALARNKAIDAIIKEDLSKIRLTHKPRYSPFVRTGIAKQNHGTHVGKNSFSSRADLIDTIVHEELHHRWWKRGLIDHHPEAVKLQRSLTNEESRKGAKFYATLARYNRMRGLPYRAEFIENFYRQFGTK
jgi:hypothetical protein